MSRGAARRWAMAAVVVGCALIAITTFRTSLTDDEPYCYEYGRRIVFGGTFTRVTPMDGSKMPVLALSALPERVAAWFTTEPLDLFAWVPLSAREHTYVQANQWLYVGRLLTIPFYALLCLLVFAWGMEVYGTAGALGATVLIAFLPTLLGHSAVVTVDAAATCTIFAAIYTLARCLLDPTIERVVIAGVACGAALLAKYSAVALGPLALALIAIRIITAEPIESKFRVAQSSLVATGLVGVITLVVVSAGFGFQQPFTRLAEITCDSRALTALSASVGNLLLPLPHDFIVGLDWVLHQDEDRSGGGSVYLLGSLHEHGVSSFFAIATLLKTPLPFLVLLVLRPWRWHRRYTDLVWLAPVLWIASQMSFTLHSQVGLRYLLPAFPFLALLAGGVWDHGRGRGWRRFAIALAALYVMETLWNCPRYLSYFNQLIGSRDRAYHYLVDSNLDWDQGRFALWRWEAQQHGRSYVLEPKYMPVSGVVVVRATEYVGVFDPETYRWLRDAEAQAAARFVGTIGDAFLIFDVAHPVEEGGTSPSDPRLRDRWTRWGATGEACE